MLLIVKLKNNPGEVVCANFKLFVCVCVCAVFISQMALQEQLDRFKKQQEKCQATLSNIAASKVSSRKATAPVATAHASSAASAANGRNAAPAVKFSNDTERLQHINSIRKAPVGAQMKRVIDILLEVIVRFFSFNANSLLFQNFRKGNFTQHLHYLVIIGLVLIQNCVPETLIKRIFHNNLHDA